MSFYPSISRQANFRESITNKWTTTEKWYDKRKNVLKTNMFSFSLFKTFSSSSCTKNWQHDKLFSNRDVIYKKHQFTKIKMGMEMKQKLNSYGKISSEAYAIWFPENSNGYEDSEFFKFHIKNAGEPALEIGCGDGRLLIPYAHEGIDVEGIDLSSYMLENCRKRAEKKGILPKLYHQAMQELNISRKFSTIYIPYGSFMLVSDIQEAQIALKKFYEHLNPMGKLLISLFIPTEHDIRVDAPKQNEWRLRREGMRSDGTTIKCWEKAQFDMKKQLENSEYLYEVFKDGTLIETEKEQLQLRWYTQEQFKDLLQKANFANITCVSGYTDTPAKHSDNEFTFIATR